MRLARYFARYYAGSTLLTFVGLIVLMVVVTLVENADRLSGAASDGAGSAMRLAFYTAAEYSFQVMPVACWVGVLVAGTLLARRGELLAMQAAGLPASRVWVTYGGVTLVAVGLGAACGELVVPEAVAGSERVLREEINYVASMTSFYERRAQWYRDGDLLLFLPSVDSAQEEFHNPVVYTMPQGVIASVIEARLLRHGPQGWTLLDARETHVDTEEMSEQASRLLPLSVRPRDLIDITGNPHKMHLAELRRVIQRRTNAGFDATAHLMEAHDRFAFPLNALWMVLLGLPWALNPDRKRSLAVTLGIGVVFVAVILAVMQMFRLLALGHKIPLVLGPWGPGIVCCAFVPVSILLYDRYRARGSLW